MKNSIAALALAGLSISASSSHAATWIVPKADTLVTVTVTGTPSDEASYSASTLNTKTGAKTSKSGKLGDVSCPVAWEVDLAPANGVLEFSALPRVAAVKADTTVDANVFSTAYRNTLILAAEKKFRSKINAAKLKLGKLEAAETSAQEKVVSNTELKNSDPDDIPLEPGDLELENTEIGDLYEAVKEAYAALDTDTAVADSLAQKLDLAKTALKEAQTDLAAAKKAKDSAAIDDAQAAIIDANAEIGKAQLEIANAKRDLADAIKELNAAAVSPSDKLLVSAALKKLGALWNTRAKAVAAAPKLTAAADAATEAVTKQSALLGALEGDYDAALVPSAEAYLSVAGADEDNYIIATVLRPNEKKPFTYAGFGAVKGADDAESAVLRFAISAGNYVLALNGESADPASYLTNGVEAGDVLAGEAPASGTLTLNGAVTTLVEQDPEDPDEPAGLSIKLNKLSLFPLSLKGKTTVTNGLIQGTIDKVPVMGVIGTFTVEGDAVQAARVYSTARGKEYSFLP